MRVLLCRIMFFILLIIIPIVAAEEYEPINYVSDYAGIIDDFEEAQINALAEEIERDTSAEVAVLTVPNLGGEDIDQFAVETFEKWGVGQKDVNNGLLMVVAVEDRKWRIEVGYGLESVITDAMAGRIGRENFVKNFQAGEYEKGIYGAVSDVKGFVEKDPSVVSAYSDSEEGIDSLLVKVLIAVFVFSILGLFEFVGIVTPSRSGWFLYFFLIPFWAAFPLALFGPYVGVGSLIAHLVSFPILRKTAKKRGWTKNFNIQSGGKIGGRRGSGGRGSSRGGSGGFGGGSSGGGGGGGGW